MTDDNQNEPNALISAGDGQLIRRQWHEGQWYFSVVDVVGLLTDTDAPRRYWSDLKRKLQSEGFEPYEKIVQLKMRSLDGKQRLTDAADVETMLRIVQSIPSPKAEPVKQWLAKVRLLRATSSCGAKNRSVWRRSGSPRCFPWMRVVRMRMSRPGRLANLYAAVSASAAYEKSRMEWRMWYSLEIARMCE